MLYLLTCLYISFYFIRPTEWVPGIIGVPIFNVLGIICSGAIMSSILTSDRRVPIKNEEKMMAGFIGAIILSHASRGYVQSSIDAVIRCLPAIIGYYLISFSLKNRGRYKGFILLLIVLIMFLSYEGWLQVTTGFCDGGGAPLIIKGRTLDGEIVEHIRITWYGIFGDPNDLGLVLVMGIPFLLNMAFNKQFLLPTICIPLITYAIFYTNSRGSYLALLASVMFYFVIRYRNKSGGIIGLVLVGILFILGPSRMSGLSSNEESAQGRLEAWHAGFQMFKSNPLLGVGQDMFLDYNNLTAHNSFVHVMAELGFFGLFFFVGLIYFPLNWLWMNLFKENRLAFSKEDLGLVSATFSSMLGMLVAMFFLSRAFILVPYIIFAMASVTSRLCAPNSESIADSLQPKQHYKNIAVATVLLIIFLQIMTKLFIQKM